MNRSVVLEEFGVCGIERGSLLVADRWVHPERGEVTCPVAPVLAAAARRDRMRARLGPVTVPAGADDACDGVLFGVSYRDPRGGVGGFAIAAPAAEPDLVAYAKARCEAWRAVLRTRRLLLVGSACSWSARGDASLPAQRGSAGATAACGCAVEAECPAVDHAVRAVRRFAAEGETVLLVGAGMAADVSLPTDAMAGVMAGVMADAGPDRVRVVSTADRAAHVAVPEPDRVVFVVVPGALMDQLGEMLSVLRGRFPALRGTHPDQWCYAMTDRQTALRSAVAEAEAIFLAGTPDIATTRMTRRESARGGVPVLTVEDPLHLEPEMLNASVVAIVSTGADPAADTLARVLSGLGPASIVRRRVHSSFETHWASSVTGSSRPR